MNAIVAIRETCLASLAAQLPVGDSPALWGTWPNQASSALKAFWRRAPKGIKRPLIVLRVPDAGGAISNYIGRRVLTVEVAVNVLADTQAQAESLLTACQLALRSAGGVYQQSRDTTPSGDSWIAAALYQFQVDEEI